MWRTAIYCVFLALAMNHGCSSSGAWDSYLNTMSAHARGSFDRGAIIGRDGSPWTSTEPSNALKITSSEAHAIANGFKDLDQFYLGITVEGTKYQFLRRDDDDGDAVYAKMKDHGFITLRASKTAILIGHCPEGGVQGYLNKSLDALAEYLESLGM